MIVHTRTQARTRSHRQCTHPLIRTHCTDPTRLSRPCFDRLLTISARRCPRQPRPQVRKLLRRQPPCLAIQPQHTVARAVRRRLSALCPHCCLLNVPINPWRYCQWQHKFPILLQLIRPRRSIRASSLLPLGIRTSSSIQVSIHRQSRRHHHCHYHIHCWARPRLATTVRSDSHCRLHLQQHHLYRQTRCH